MPWAVLPWMGPVSARKAGREWTVLLPALQAPGGPVATKPASVPMEQPVSLLTEDAPAWLGGKAASAHSHARAGSTAWDAVGSVPVKMQPVVTPSLEDAAACLDGKDPVAASCVQRACGGSSATRCAPARTGPAVPPRMASVSAPQASGGPTASGPANRAVMARSAPCPASVPITPSATLWTAPATVRLAGRAAIVQDVSPMGAKPRSRNPTMPLVWGPGMGLSPTGPLGQDWAIQASCGGVPTLPPECHFLAWCNPWRQCIQCFAGCTSGFFGNNCTSRCQCQHGALCDPGTGSCSCPSGYTGAHCETSHPDHPLTMVPALPAANPSLGAVIGIIILAALLAAVLVFFFCYRRCQKEKEKRHISVAYTTGRTDSSEYVVPDVPPNYTHYYSNPSYHTLSPCSPSFTIPSSSDQPGKSLERDWSGLHGADCNATLPSDWKHHRESPAHGGGYLDRSCSYMDGLGKYRCQVHAKEGPWRCSNSSLSSENPYATIKDCPAPAGKVPEGSYMEMKCPPSSKREISLFKGPSCRSEAKEEDGSAAAEGVSQGTPAVPPNHYDSPKNSHIPSHYDVPPVRHYPPSPPLRRQAR
uniref:EGF-like domain-containing protein n=1 Tax=Laticauda laticaudata TaxID=8630 RepID=A0A8C5RTZ6_LATLA